MAGLRHATPVGALSATTAGSRRRVVLRVVRRLLLVACIAWLALEAFRWWRTADDMRQVRAVDAGTLAGEPSRALPTFALAQREGGAGRYHEALREYRRIVDRQVGGVEEPLRASALYNTGNLHLREAQRLRNEDQIAQALAILELAKRNYRDALAIAPAAWDARYNLERVLRLSPELEDADEVGGGERRQSERAVTTMRGFTLGLP